MDWNYRVVKREDKGQEWYAIHEVYYDEQGKPEMITESAISPSGETIDEVRRDLEYMQRALTKPAVNYVDIATPEDD